MTRFREQAFFSQRRKGSQSTQREKILLSLLSISLRSLRLCEILHAEHMKLSQSRRERRGERIKKAIHFFACFAILCAFARFIRTTSQNPHPLNDSSVQTGFREHPCISQRAQRDAKRARNKILLYFFHSLRSLRLCESINALNKISRRAAVDAEEFNCRAFTSLVFPLRALRFLAPLRDSSARHHGILIRSMNPRTP